MAAVAQGNTALLSFAWNSAKRCPLSSQGQAFNFSVAIGKYFCISVFMSFCFSSSYFILVHLSSLEVVLVLIESFCAVLGVGECCNGWMNGHPWS